MKTTLVTLVTAILTALGGYFATKYALPKESVNDVVAGLVTALTGAFGIYAAKYIPATPAPAKVEAPAKTE